MVGKKLTTRRHFLKSLALGSAFISYWPCHMRMAIASEHTNQHKFNTLYLFDEEQWYLKDTEIYAKSIKGVFTDIMIMVYGHYWGGTMGWESTAMPLYVSGSKPISITKLSEVIPIFHRHGIRVHAIFNTCRADATRGKYPALVPSAKTKLVDPHNPAFQEDISNLTADCARLGVDGINLNFIMTDYNLEGGVPADQVKNDASIEKIVRMIYEKVKVVNPDCIVSSTTVPYHDITNPHMVRSGRKAINWANRGIQDIIFGFELGIPPNLEFQNPEGIRALITNDTPFIGMYGNWTRDGAPRDDGSLHPPREGNSIPQSAELFTLVLNAVAHEPDIAIYNATQLSQDHVDLLKARVVPEPSP